LPAEGIKELQHGATDEDLSSPMILIVDDNQLLLDMMSDFLEAKQFRTVKSQSGRELLEKIEDINPDVILMDIQMPVMDGLEAIRRIRAHKNAKIASTLIIAVTALAMPGDREKCLETGANEYLSKPIFLAQLVERIREFLKDKDGRQST
jgi:CheY-like chemotaxis protein